MPDWSGWEESNVDTDVFCASVGSVESLGMGARQD